MPVNVRPSSISKDRIELKITNTDKDATDERTRGPRYEFLNRQEALALIKQLAGALERMDAR